MPYRDAEDRRRYDRDRKRSLPASRSSAPLVLPADARIGVANDIGTLLSEAVRLVLSDQKAKNLEKARALGYLSSVGLRLLEVHDLERRLDALEQALKFQAIHSGETL